MSDWRDRAYCRTDPDLWFDGKRADRAAAWCAVCPVREPCSQDLSTFMRDFRPVEVTWAGEFYPFNPRRLARTRGAA